MATDFQTKEVQNLGTSFTDLTGVFHSGEVVVHAIYISNKHATETIGFYLSLYDREGRIETAVVDNQTDPWEPSQNHAAFGQTSTSGTGSGATYTVATNSAGAVTTVTNVDAGNSYAIGDTLIFTDPHENTNETFRLTVSAIFSDVEKASILYNIEIAPKSTLVLEKPINLTASTDGTLKRQLKVKASTGTDIDVVASVLVIT